MMGNGMNNYEDRQTCSASEIVCEACAECLLHCPGSHQAYRRLASNAGCHPPATHCARPWHASRVLQEGFYA